MPSHLHRLPEFTGIGAAAPRFGTRTPPGARASAGTSGAPIHLAGTLILGALLTGCARPGLGRGPVWIDRSGKAMGAKVEVSIEAPSLELAVSASNAVLSAVGAADALLSPNRPDSRVSALNGLPIGATDAFDPDLCRTLDEVGRIAAEVPGAFDPVIGSLIHAWDLDGKGRVPSITELDAARRAAGRGGMVLNLQQCTAQRLAAAASLVTRGFAKGYALRAARDTLMAHGIHSVRIKFGEQVMVLGPSREGGPWHVAIPSVEDGQDEVFTLWLAGGSASTSSQSSRFVRAAGQTIGHILNPQTGTPVPGWGILTVVAADPLRADILSTALFALGPDSALAWANRHPDVGVLVLDRRDGAIHPRWNEGLRRALDSATAVPIR